MDETYRDAQPCNAGKAKIEAFAASFAQGIGLKPGEALEPVVIRMGGHLHYQPFPELETSAQASIRVRAKGDFDIYLADYTTPEQDRFSIAHEIGHYLLHFPQQADAPMKAARFGSSRVEWEANWFAAGFLMPEADYRARHAATGGDIRALARHFGVSKAAAKVRARSLGLSD